MSEQKGVFVLMRLSLLFCRSPVCFLVFRFDFFVFISLFDSFNVIARLDRAIRIEDARVKPHPAERTGEAADDGK